MGYQTYYEIEVSTKYGASDYDELIDDVCTALETKFDIVEDTDIFKIIYNILENRGYESSYSKDDICRAMIILSKHFPDYYFVLDGDGEHSDDLWIATYNNGKEFFQNLVIEPIEFSDIDWDNIDES